MIHLSPGQSVMGKSHERGVLKQIIGWLRNHSKISLVKWILVASRLINVVIDAYLTNKQIQKTDHEIVIFDRYFYDVLAFVDRDTKAFKSVIWMIAKLSFQDLIWHFISLRVTLLF